MLCKICGQYHTDNTSGICDWCIKLNNIFYGYKIMNKYMGTTKYVRPKVYCQNCKYFSINECLHKTNKYCGDYKSPKTICFNLSPHMLNIGNNCKNYKRKWWKI